MAEANLRSGFTRIVNGLYEALVRTRFSATHHQIVHCLIRLTYGWRRYSVRISQQDLAAECDIPMGGQFRETVRDLIEQQIIIELEPASGRRSAVYMVNKYPQSWGPKYHRNDERTDGLFRALPPSGDEKEAERRLTEIGQSIESYPARIQAPYETPEPRRVPGFGAVDSLDSGVQDLGHFPPNTTNGKDLRDLPLSLDERKERKQQQQQRPLAVRDADNADNRTAKTTTDFAIGIATAANAGITARWGEQPNPLHYASALPMVPRLIELRVDLEVARQAVVESCKRSKKDRPPNTLAWFENPILDAARASEQRTLNASAPAVGSPGAVGGVSAAAIGAATRDRQAEEHRGQEEAKIYDADRQLAAHAWGKSHPEEMATIVAQADAHYAAALGYASGRRMRDTAVVLACAERCGFPPIEAWRAKRAHAPPDKPPESS